MGHYEDFRNLSRDQKTDKYITETPKMHLNRDQTIFRIAAEFRSVVVQVHFGVFDV